MMMYQIAARQQSKRDFLDNSYRLIDMARMTSMFTPRSENSRQFDRNVDLFEMWVRHRAATDF